MFRMYRCLHKCPVLKAVRSFVPQPDIVIDKSALRAIDMSEKCLRTCNDVQNMMCIAIGSCGGRLLLDRYAKTLDL